MLGEQSTIRPSATMHQIHLPESMAAAARHASASPSTSCCACRWRWSCASGRSSARPRASATSVDGDLRRPGSTPRCPFALTGAQQRAIAEIDRRPGRAPPDAPAAAGRRGLGQDGGRRHRPARRPCRAATRARSWRPPRCWPSSTTSAVRAPARRPDRARRAHAHRRPAAAGRAAHQPHDGRPSAPASRPGWPTARSTSSSAPTPC